MYTHYHADLELELKARKLSKTLIGLMGNLKNITTPLKKFNTYDDFSCTPNKTSRGQDRKEERK